MNNNEKLIQQLEAANLKLTQQNRQLVIQNAASKSGAFNPSAFAREVDNLVSADPQTGELVIKVGDDLLPVAEGFKTLKGLKTFQHHYTEFVPKSIGGNQAAPVDPADPKTTFAEYKASRPNDRI